jgi:hypothetical protein
MQMMECFTHCPPNDPVEALTTGYENSAGANAAAARLITATDISRAHLQCPAAEGTEMQERRSSRMGMVQGLEGWLLRVHIC